MNNFYDIKNKRLSLIDIKNLAKYFTDKQNDGDEQAHSVYLLRCEQSGFSNEVIEKIWKETF